MNRFYYGCVFVQYNGKFKDKRGKTHTLVSIDGVDASTVGVGHAFPNVAMLSGVNNIITVDIAPCPKMGYANTLGQELYVFEYEKDRDEGIDFEAHSYMLPYCTRPQLLVDVRSDAE
ncbi:major capsid protein [Shigella phage vB_SflM_004]|nr:major capsid protein [Shigella phage vB_SflM_004]